MQNIKLIILDVDGVLTDGNITIGSNGTEFKSFNVKDGMGISLAKFYGIKFAIITGRRSEVVKIRAEELNIDYLFEGIHNKFEVFLELLNSTGLSSEDVAFIGDDINDLAILRKVGFS
ncbi:HAD family hydrolase, partial [Butyricicoccus sp. 1XD8-22]